MEQTRVTVHLAADSYVGAQALDGPIAMGTFGSLHIGSVTFFLPGRDADAGPAARALAGRISEALFAMGAEADAKAKEKAEAAPPETGADPRDPDDVRESRVEALAAAAAAEGDYPF